MCACTSGTIKPASGQICFTSPAFHLKSSDLGFRAAWGNSGASGGGGGRGEEADEAEGRERQRKKARRELAVPACIAHVSGPSFAPRRQTPAHFSLSNVDEPASVPGFLQTQ